jgi:hypothetical protein
MRIHMNSCEYLSVALNRGSVQSTSIVKTLSGRLGVTILIPFSCCINGLCVLLQHVTYRSGGVGVFEMPSAAHVAVNDLLFVAVIPTGSARARLAHGLKLDDLELSCPVLIGGSGSIAFPYQPPSPILRDWICTKYSRQRRHVHGRFAAKNAPAGQRQIRTISVRRIRAGHWDDYLPAPASASGSGKRRLGEVQVSAACCADLFWTDRGSLPLLTPWP